MVVIGSAVASVFAYRHFNRNDNVAYSFSLDSKQGTGGRAFNQDGVLVTDIDPDGPAASAGLRRGSIILEVNGESVNTPQELRRSIQQHEAGETITLTVLNGEEVEEIEVTLASVGPYLGVDIGGQRAFPGQGQFDIQPFLPPNFEFPRDGGMPRFPEGRPPFSENLLAGAFVSFVEPDSPASDADLQPGDVITEVDNETVDSREQLIESISQKNPGDDVELAVRRGDETLTISVTLDSHPEDASRAYLGIRLAPFTFRQQFREGFFHN
jgi:serine protease Do